ncbi:MAG: hypothetical protein CSA40_02295 [Flavobacteriales bacterium]|nr:MAG: hypothetical protein CSA40_02295 [Flavobacteriales bacterium]
MKKRILVNKKLNKTFNVELENNCVTYQTLKNGKGRVYTKAFSCDEEALKFFSKKQWEVLKKGFVLCQKTNRFGEPKLHYYIGGGYSGALSFTHTQNAIWVYQEGSYENPDNQYDFIKSISYQGDTLEQIKTPDILAWDMQCLNNNTLLLNLDHHIYTYVVVLLFLKTDNYLPFIAKVE